MILVGLEYYGNPFIHAQEWSEKNEIGLLWKRFMQLSQKFGFLLEKLSVSPGRAYEMHFEPEDYLTTRNLSIFIGINVDQIREIPLEFVVKPLPSTSYLTFSSTMQDKSNLEFFFRNWLQNNDLGYFQAYPYILQEYDESFTSVEDPESRVHWLIPVMQK